MQSCAIPHFVQAFARARRPVQRRDVAGAHIWFATSTSIEVRETWSFLDWGGSTGSHGDSCGRFERAALSAAQLDLLEGITLVPIAESCSLDGYSYHELTVLDVDGSVAQYRDTGCSYLRVAGAQAMLPAHAVDDGVDNPARFDSGTPCTGEPN